MSFAPIPGSSRLLSSNAVQASAWYLPHRRASVVERIDGSPACAEPGAYLLARVETEVPAGLDEVARIGPPESAFGAVLWRVPAP